MEHFEDYTFENDEIFGYECLGCGHVQDEDGQCEMCCDNVTEAIYCNFPEPTRLHDYRCIGIDYRDRERIAKKVNRKIEGLLKLPDLERNAILDGIREKIGY